MEPQGSSQCSTGPANGPHSEANQSSAHPPNLFLKGP